MDLTDGLTHIKDKDKDSSIKERHVKFDGKNDRDYGYGNVMTPLIDLLTKRYDAQLFTVVTTNLGPNDIRKRYGDRIADRLNEMMVKIVYRNPTYRTDDTLTADNTDLR